jgi:hypothetical protein
LLWVYFIFLLVPQLPFKMSQTVQWCMNLQAYQSENNSYVLCPVENKLSMILCCVPSGVLLFFVSGGPKKVVEGREVWDQVATWLRVLRRVAFFRWWLEKVSRCFLCCDVGEVWRSYIWVVGSWWCGACGWRVRNVLFDFWRVTIEPAVQLIIFYMVAIWLRDVN